MNFCSLLIILSTELKYFSSTILISLPNANMFYHSYLKPSLFICRERRATLSKPAVIWTHDRDVRGIGLFSILRHKLLCIPVFKEILHCKKALCDVKSRIDPCLSHHGRGSKLLLVLPDNFARLARQIKSDILR